MERKLAAIFAADVAGYSRMMAENEEMTLRTLGTYRGTISEIVSEHRGRIFGTAGDSVVAEFPSTVQAVRAAVAIQRALARRNADLPERQRMEFRIGINVGDVVVDGDDLLGDGINVAARLQSVAQPGGICVSGAVREQIDGKVTLPTMALGERTLKNIPRPVQIYAIDWRSDDSGTMSVLGGTLQRPDKPSIAVLPFVNMSGDPEQEYFADGITEDIITALSHHRWFFVIARNSSFTYKGKPIDVKVVSRELGVRYVLEGSVRKAGNRVRATGQLIDAESGAHLWAERYDRDLADIFALQDEITQNVVAAIEPEMLMVEGRRAARKAAASPDAFDCYMRGIWHFHQFGPEDSRQAEVWLRKAIALDPDLAQAHIFLARALNNRVWWAWSRDIERDMADAHAAANRALVLDDRDPYGHYIMFWVSIARREYAQALSEVQRAIDLSPNFALGYFALGLIRIYIGHFAEATDPLLRAIRLTPNDPQIGAFLGHLALAQYHLGNYEEAVHYAQQAVRVRSFPFIRRTLLASLGQLGRADEAKAVRTELEQIKPANAELYWELTTPYADAAHRAHLLEGLRKAGWTG